MNKKILIALVVVLLAAVAGGLVYFKGGNLQGLMKKFKGVTITPPVKMEQAGLPEGAEKINLELLTVHPYPISTNLMLNKWGGCNHIETTGYIFELQRMYGYLISRIDNNGTMGSTAPIFENTNMEIIYQCANYQPLLFCNAKVLGPGSLVDTDGDGIRNDREFFMGLNPCEKYSIGGTIADGDFDYDGDGILNKDDSNPICNLNGLYPSDCI